MIFEQEERERLLEEALAHERAMTFAENQCTHLSAFATHTYIHTYIHSM
jgi:hypothetical protein